jgi:O-antigen ligase
MQTTFQQNGFRVAPASPPVVRQVGRLMEYAFYLFIASIPFETINTVVGTEDFSLAKLCGYGMVLVAIGNGMAFLHRPPAALLCFVLYLAVYFARGLAQPDQYWNEILSLFFSMAQSLVLFWISYVLLLDEGIRRRALVVFACSCALLAVLQLIGITEERARDVSRTTALAEDPNTVAAQLGMAALIALGMCSYIRHPLYRALLYGMAAVSALEMVHTGSRGSLVASVIGILIVMAYRNRQTGKRPVILVCVLLFLLGISVAVSQVSFSRWENTIKYGSLATREEIYSNAVTMYFEHPILGWGPTTHYKQLGELLGLQSRDEHNVVLWVLNECGLLGGIPFLLGCYYCIRAAWRGRFGSLGIMPFALVVCLVLINLNNTLHVRKFFWITMACGLASAPLVHRAARPQARPRVALKGNV